MTTGEDDAGTLGIVQGDYTLELSLNKETLLSTGSQVVNVDGYAASYNSGWRIQEWRNDDLAYAWMVRNR